MLFVDEKYSGFNGIIQDKTRQDNTGRTHKKYKCIFVFLYFFIFLFL